MGKLDTIAIIQSAHKIPTLHLSKESLHPLPSGCTVVALTSEGVLDVQLQSQVLQTLLPASLLEDAEDTACLSAIPHSPQPQGRHQGFQTTSMLVGKPSKLCSKSWTSLHNIRQLFIIHKLNICP